MTSRRQFVQQLPLPLASMPILTTPASPAVASAKAGPTSNASGNPATTDPGAVHLLNGLYDAKMEDAPVLAITGTVNRDLPGTQFTKEVDTVKILQDDAVYNQQITGPVHVLTVVDIACRAACGAPPLPISR